MLLSMTTATARKTDMTVPNTIRQQIGNRAFFMMGAKNLCGDATSLQFKICGSKVTHIRVTLDPSDTYTVAFIRVRGRKVTELASEEGVYADSLNRVIASNTGLALSL